MTKNQSKKQLNSSNSRGKEQFSEFLNLKNQGYVSTNLKTEGKKTSKSPALKLKDKLSDQFDVFMHKHRFSAIMTGNAMYQGKNANFYINMKKIEGEHILDETLRNMEKSRSQRNTNESINETFLNESFAGSGGK